MYATDAGRIAKGVTRFLTQWSVRVRVRVSVGHAGEPCKPDEPIDEDDGYHCRPSRIRCLQMTHKYRHIFTARCTDRRRHKLT